MKVLRNATENSFVQVFKNMSSWVLFFIDMFNFFIIFHLCKLGLFVYGMAYGYLMLFHTYYAV